MTTPQIIRTMDEYLELDPDTYVIWKNGVPRNAADALNVAALWTAHFVLPAVVIATGDQVRAAREALEELS